MVVMNRLCYGDNLGALRKRIATKSKLLLAAAFVMAAVGVVAIPAASPAARAAGSLTPIKHIVVLMQENHTLDSELGAWCNQTGRCTGIPARVTLSNGARIAPSVAPDIMPAVKHTVASQTAAIDGGKMDGWQNITGCAAPAYACVSYYPAAAVPNLTALAGA
jgi:phospholipase C